MKFIFATLLSALISSTIISLNAQEHNAHSNKNIAHHIHKNDVAGFIGATYIFESGFVLPTFGVEYVRKLNPYFGIGAIAEMEVGSHIISMDQSSNEQAEVERESAFLLLPALYFTTGKFVASIGYGVELEKSQNLGLLKVTAYYVLDLKKDYWYAIPSLSWDYTSQFNGLVYGFNIARSF